MKAVLRRTSGPLVCLSLFLGAAACETAKSANPLSPAIAGPIEGVVIGEPKLLEPGANQQIKDKDQPFTVIIENPASTSPRPFLLRMQIATDINFASVVWTRSGIEPGANGQTKFRMPERLQPGRNYFWRTQADDGANKSEWSAPRGFEILMPTKFGKPTPREPVNNQQVSTNRPVLKVDNASAQGPVGQAYYHFQVAKSPSFSDLVVNQQTPQQGGGTKLTTGALTYSTTYYWRVRVSDGETTGDWSETETFRTGAEPAPSPSPTPGPPGPVASCGPPWPTTGPGIIACVKSRYPEKLVAGISLSQRVANMEFLRDRVIEVGICSGFDLAWNLKRGRGPHSIDALAWKHSNGFVDVVDIGTAYDDTSRTLGLWWGIVAGPPGYDPYSPRPSC